VRCRSAAPRVVAVDGDAVEFVDEDVAGNGARNKAAKAFAGVFIDDRGNLELCGGCGVRFWRPPS
jgi:hypothetical protein